MLRTSILFIVGGALSPIFSLAAAQENHIVPRAFGPIDLDGRVEEQAWLAVEPLPAVQQIPTFRSTPSERSEFRLIYDDRYLYFSCRNFDSDPAGIRATSLLRDDPSFTNDWCAVNLDTFLDRETSVVFAVSPSGVRTDVVFEQDAETAPNFGWNTFWDGVAHRNADGWSIEIRIPWSSLRFQQDADGHVAMGLTAWRLIARKNEMITYPPVSPEVGSMSVFKASQSAIIEFEDAPALRPLYITPYGLGGMGSTTDLNDAETEYISDANRVTEVGLDIKTGLAENATLDLTANTDFAQVEADDQQVNLTRFSLFFPERRLFFQERSAVFDFSLGEVNRVFYSRRIGLDEDGHPLRIYGGARFVGRIGGWDVGALDMHADAEETRGSENFGVVRLRRRVVNDNSYVGGIVTHRRAADGSYNLVYGVDGIFRVRDQDYLTVTWAQSFDDEDDAATGFFDRGFTRVRWERRSIDGLTYAADVSQAGTAFSPGMGFLRRADYLRIGDRIGYGWRAGPDSPILRQQVELGALVFRRNDLELIETAEFSPEWSLETKSGGIFAVNGTLTYDDVGNGFELSDDAEVIGGDYTFVSGGASFTASTTALLRVDLSALAGQFYDGWRVSGAIAPAWNVSRHMQLSGTFSVDHIWFPDRQQEFTGRIVRLRAQLMASAVLTATALVQYNSAEDVVIGNLRVRYNPREGIDLWIVYNERQNTSRFREYPALPLVGERTLLIKYQHTVNLGI
jgi:hypothetical protein